MLQELKNAEQKLVGSKQVLKALKTGELKRVYLAKDAEEGLFHEILTAAEENGVDCVFVSSKKELGEICGIEVKAACAALKK